MIEASNLALGNIKTRFTEDEPPNTIIGQEPLSGYRVIQGSVVNIIINRKMDNIDSEFLHGSGGIVLFRYRLKNGFLRRHIRARLNSFGVSNDLFDDYMLPGEELWVLIPRNNDATFGGCLFFYSLY